MFNFSKKPAAAVEDVTGRGESALSLGATTLRNSSIAGMIRITAGSFLNGHIHAVICGKGAITDAELLTLEKWVASLQGRSL